MVRFENRDGQGDRPARPRRRNGLWRNHAGTAGIEFAIIGSALVLALLNGMDLARYFYLRAALQNVAQMAAQTAWQSCTLSQLPATTNCPGFNAAVTASVQSSQLGSQATLATGSPSEAWYCVDSSGALVNVAAITDPKPASCASVGNASGLPGDYVAIQTSYAYTPMFPAVSVASNLPATLTATTMMRLQ